MIKRFLGTLLFFAIFFGDAIHAQNSGPSKDPFSFDLSFTPAYPRSYVLAPLLSFILPGFDQWYEGQYTAAAAYSGIALVGSMYSSAHYLALGNSNENRQDRLKELSKDHYAKDFSYRSYALGSKIYETMGGLSSYHAFRTAAKTQMPYGKFSFLEKNEETVPEILMAPFNFSYLSRPNTYITLLIGLGLALNDQLLSKTALKTADMKRSPFLGNDLFFASANSFNAGTHEEAMFRGWLLPVFYEATRDSLLSNLATTGLFALAHMPSIKVPLIQGLLGFHLGRVTLENSFSIKEAVFIHMWWDVIAFASMYSFAKATDDQKLLSTLSFSLPVLATTF